MAASGATPIVIYHSVTPTTLPLAANLAPGELAVNIADMKLYCENSSGVVTLLADATANGTVTSVNVSGGTTGLTTSGGPVTTSGTITLTGTLAVANGGTGVTASTGTTAVVLSTSPTLVTPLLGTPTSGTLSNCTVDGTNPVGFINIPAIADKTAAYTLATGDRGKVVGVGSGGSIEIPDATFAAGDAVLIFNNTAGDVTITCTITTAYIAGADVDVASVTLATRGVANILFISGTVSVLTGNIA